MAAKASAKTELRRMVLPPVKGAPKGKGRDSCRCLQRRGFPPQRPLTSFKGNEWDYAGEMVMTKTGDLLVILRILRIFVKFMLCPF